MTEEVVEKSNISKPEVSEVQTKASELGWRPKEEYDGDATAWVDAEEFLRRAPLYEGLSKANKTIKQMQKKLEVMAQHSEEVKQAAYDKAIADLKAQKKVAAKENDVEKVVAIDEQLDTIQEQVKSVKATAPTKSTVEQTFSEWKETNTWYEEDEDLQFYANGFGNRIQEEHKDWNPEQVLEEITKRVKKKFPDKFKNTNRSNPGKVSTPSTNGANMDLKNKLPTFSDLPEEAKQVYKTLVKSKNNPRGVLSSEQYLKDYALKAGLIKDEE